MKNRNEALAAEKKHLTLLEDAAEYLEHFDILETITNVGNDEVFTPRKTCEMLLDALPEDIAMDIRFLKTTFLYQAGRIEESFGYGRKAYPVKQLIDASQLLSMIEGIGTNVKRFELLCKYVEALVAFYKYRSVELTQQAEQRNQNHRQSNRTRQ